MSDAARPNIYTEDWQREMEHGNYGVRGSQVGLRPGPPGWASHLRPGRRVGSPDAVAYMLSTELQLEYFEGEPE